MAIPKVMGTETEYGIAAADIGRRHQQHGFKEDFDLVGTHLGRAQSKFGEAEKRLDRFEGKLERAAEQDQIVEPATPAQLPIAVDAA